MDLTRSRGTAEGWKGGRLKAEFRDALRAGTSAICIAWSLFWTPASAEEPFYLRGGEAIVFFGDSITQSGQYVNYVEAYLLTRFPDKQFRLINHGISSETVSGTSEPDHEPRRPDAHPRFARDVAAWKPDVVAACFGMNDGNYHPFEAERFAKYQAGVRRLIDRVRDEAGAKRLTILTPPPYDAYRRTAIDPAAKSYGYKFAYLGYDETLERYSRWLTTLRSPELVVADDHAAIDAHVRKRRETLVSFTVSPDAVHPDATGHWLMAQTLLLAWRAPALAAEAAIDAERMQVRSGKVRNLKRDGPGVQFTWVSPLPLPLDPQWDPQSIELERVGERLNRYRLTVAGLAPGRYRVIADGAAVGEAAHDELAAGVDLNRLANFPTVALARGVLKQLTARNAAVYAAWRKSIAAGGSGRPSAAEAAVFERQTAELRANCQPREVNLRIAPLAAQ